MDKLIEDAGKMSVKELKAALKARSITLNANKVVLVERLIKEIKRDELENLHGAVGGDFLLEHNVNDDTRYEDAKEDHVSDSDAGKRSSDNDSSSDDDNEANPTVAVPAKSAMFTFKDVEESMQRFSGDRKQNLRKWLKDFEDNAKIMKWSKIHKLVYAKRLLTGAAKMFINVEESVTSYKQLKKCLKSEFGKPLSSVKIHKQMATTKKLQAETYREFLYRMMAIAEQANVDLESTFQYVIDGIDDTESNKSVLYGVSTLRDFKNRLDSYELMKSKSSSNSTKSDKSSFWNKKSDGKKDTNTSKDDKKTDVKSRRCFRCGASGHDVKSCKNELKCFKCNKGGHISKDCLSTEADSQSHQPKSCNAIIDDDDAMMKNVKLVGYPISALVDTGSPYTLITLNIFYKIGAPKLHPEKHECKGVGKGKFETLGSFERQIDIDGQFYNTVIHVTHDDDIDYDMILGKPLLKQTGLILDDSGLQLTKTGGLELITVDEIRDDIVNLSHKHIFASIDAFTKFVWLFPVRSTTSAESINKLKVIQSTFGNARRIVDDRGTAFTSKEFTDYLKEQNIEFRPITTGVPRANGQVERLNTIVIAVLTKLSVDNPMTWYRHVDRVQRYINSTYQRSVGTTPFQLMFGTKMRQVEDILLAEWLQDDVIDDFCHQREVLRSDAKRQILKVQSENTIQFNRRRKAPHQYKVDDIIAIKRTQFGVGLKLRGKFLGPYRVTKVKGMERYDVIKVGDHEGPNKTSTCAEFMKPWATHEHDVSSESDEC